MSRPAYKSTQQDLYSIARSGWNACLNQVEEFKKIRTRYTPAFIADRLKEIDLAEQLPDADQREEESRIARIQLEQKASEGLAAWRLLKNYVTDAFPESEHETRLDACGQAHYRRAAQNEWASVQRLLLDGTKFIGTNKDALVHKGSMPEVFTGTFSTLRDELAAAHQRFLDASLNYGVQTQLKIKTNNDLHVQLMKMFRDGQEIFRKDEALKKLFTFDQVALTVAGPGSQGLKGDITEPGDEPVAGAQVAFTGPTNKTVIADENGRYECPQLKEGLYTANITAPGFDPLTIKDIEVTTGSMQVRDFILVKG